MTNVEIIITMKNSDKIQIYSLLAKCYDDSIHAVEDAAIVKRGKFLLTPVSTLFVY